jgi:multicomponent Na+:H+ antiporter subunit F
MNEFELLLKFMVAAMLLASLCPLYRLVVGRTLADRAVAFDALTINTAGLLALICIHMQTDAFVEAILILALMGFLGTLSIARFIERGQLITIDTDVHDDPDDDLNPFLATESLSEIPSVFGESEFLPQVGPRDLAEAGLDEDTEHAYSVEEADDIDVPDDEDDEEPEGETR